MGRRVEEYLLRAAIVPLSQISSEFDSIVYMDITSYAGRSLFAIDLPSCPLRRNSALNSKIFLMPLEPAHHQRKTHLPILKPQHCVFSSYHGNQRQTQPSRSAGKILDLFRLANSITRFQYQPQNRHYILYLMQPALVPVWREHPSKRDCHECNQHYDNPNTCDRYAQFHVSLSVLLRDAKRQLAMHQLRRWFRDRI